jgi:hypothetical protein
MESRFLKEVARSELARLFPTCIGSLVESFYVVFFQFCSVSPWEKSVA